MPTSRPTIQGMESMVSSGHYLASTAAHDILQAGGNAVDAGCAAGLVLGVVQPDIVNVAGVAPIMIRLAATGETISIAGLGTWPKALSRGYFMDHHAGTIPAGVKRSVVPAAPDAWITALAKYGTMSFADIAQAAIRHAARGFVVYPLLADSLEAHREEYLRWPSSRDIFMPGGRAPKTGDLFRQSDLAGVLQYMVAEEKAASGSREAGLETARKAFYEGDIASAIVRFYAQEGGLLSLEDLANYRSPTEPVIQRSWRDMQISVCGPWCQGPTLLHSLKILEHFDLSGITHNSPRMIDLMARCMNLAFADREKFYGDPRFIDVPMDLLLSDDYTRKQAAEIDATSRSLDEQAPPSSEEPKAEPDTSYVAVIDREGNAFSATPSDGSWAVPIVPGTGLVVSGRGSQSRPDPEHPSGALAGKRPRLTPSPAIAVRGTEIMPFGTPGGDVQPQAMLQVLCNKSIYGMDLQAAIDAPRFATYDFPSSFAPFAHHANLLMIEEDIPAETRAELQGLGYQVKTWSSRHWLAGGVCAVTYDCATGILSGGADPRRPSYAIGG